VQQLYDCVKNKVRGLHGKSGLSHIYKNIIDLRLGWIHAV